MLFVGIDQQKRHLTICVWDEQGGIALRRQVSTKWEEVDRRDAARLSEMLWINRDRIATGQKLVHISEVYQPTERAQYDRQLTHVRYRLGRALTRAKNSINGILRRHNLEQECPTSRMNSSVGSNSRSASSRPRRTGRGGNTKVCVGCSRRRSEDGRRIRTWAKPRNQLSLTVK